MPRLGGDTNGRGDAPDDEAGEHGVAQGLELRSLPLSLRRDIGSLHDRDRRAGGDLAVCGRAAGHGGGHRALAEFDSGGTIALEELRGLSDTVRLHGVGGHSAGAGT